jgi:hypothetical protein
MAAGDVDVKITKMRAMKGAFFNGTSAYINIATVIPELSVAYPFSVSLWFITNDMTTERCLWGSAKGANDIFTLGIRTGEFRIGVYNGAWSAKTSGNTGLNATGWNHIVYTYNPTGVVGKLYINGTLQVGVTAPNGIATIAQSLGKRNDAGSFFAGLIKDFLVYNVVLTQAEATSIYNNTGVTRGLIHAYRLQDNYTDSVGTFNGTNVNASIMAADDTVKLAVATQRTATGATGKFYITRGLGGQVVHVAIDE